jgi:hypothetical protein
MDKKIQLQSWGSLGVIGLAVVLLLQGCATGYQPLSARGGYSERRIADDIYEVVFSGNGKTPKATVDRYFIYRCAELTKQKGFKYFAIMRTNRPATPPPAATPPGVPPPQAPVPAPGQSGSGIGPGAFRHAAFESGERHNGGFLEVRGGGGGGGGRGGGYYYSPGGMYYITSYVGRATIRMFNDNTLPGPIVGYPVAEVMQRIGPFIKDQFAVVEIPRPSLIDPVSGVMPLPDRAVAPASNGNAPAASGNPPAGGGALPPEPDNPGPPADGGGPPPTNDKAT